MLLIIGIDRYTPDHPHQDLFSIRAWRCATYETAAGASAKTRPGPPSPPGSGRTAASPAPPAPSPCVCFHSWMYIWQRDVSQSIKPPEGGLSCPPQPTDRLLPPTTHPAAPSSSALSAALRQASAVGEFCMMRRHHLSVSASSSRSGTTWFTSCVVVSSFVFGGELTGGFELCTT